MNEIGYPKMLLSGKWHVDFDEHGKVTKVVYDDTYYKLLGYDKKNLPGTRKKWEELIHPDDRERVLNSLNEFAQKKDQFNYDIEYKLMTHNGYRLFHIYGVCARNEDGSLKTCEGIIIDIQESLDKYTHYTTQEKLVENNARILALEDKFESLYDVDLETGSYEVYIKGLTFGDINSRMCNSNDFFEDTKKNINVIHTNDHEEILKILTPEHISNALKNSSHFDTYYRLIVGDKPLWVRMRILYKDVQKKHIIVGVFNAEEEVKTRQKEERIRKKLISRMMGDGRVFLINCETGCRKTLQDRQDESINYSDEENFSITFEEYINSLVADVDREKMWKYTDTAYIMDCLKNERELSVEFREKQGNALVFHEMKFAKFSDTEVLQSFKQIDREIKERLVNNKLRDDYFSFFSVDLDSDIIQVLKESKLNLIGKNETQKQYTKAILDFADSYTGETKKFFEQIGNLSYLKRKLKKEDKLSYTFKSLFLDKSKWIKSTCYVLSRHNNGIPSLIALGFNFADSIESKSMELQDQLKEDMTIIGGLASEYHALYYFNIEKNLLKTISINKTNFFEASEFIKNSSYSLDMLQIYTKSGLIHPDDQKQFDCITIEYIKEKLAHSKKFSIRYRRKFDDSFRWVEMDVIKYEDIDNPANAVAVGFAIRDNEIRQEQERAKEQELATQQRQFKAFGKIVNAALWNVEINSENYISNVYVSDEFRRMLEYKSEKDFPNKLDAWIEKIHPEDRDTVLYDFENSVKSINATDFIYDVKYRLQKKNSNYCWVHTMGRMEQMENGMRKLFGIIMDITSEKKLEEQHTLSDGLAREYHTIWILESEGEHKLHHFRSTGNKTINTTELDKGAVTYETAVNTYISTYVHEEDRERVREASKFETVVQETQDIGTYSISYRRYSNGHEFDYHQMCFAKAATDDGRTNYILAFRDADKMMREQISQQEKLQEALLMAQSANKSKTNFLFNMSHDIRTPINAITGFTTMAKRYADNKDKVIDLLDKIDVSGKQLLMLINQVLEMSRIESGKIQVEEKPINIAKNNESLVTILSEQAKAAGLDFHHSQSDISHFKVLADEARVSQITLNIVSNAIKYTPKGGKIDMRFRENACNRKGYANYTLSVIDTGIGMSEEFQKELFKPFSREKNSTVSKIQGTGLGMSIVKSLVDMMGGTIEVHSELGKGSRFDVTLDFKINEKEKNFQESELPSELECFKGRCVLLVEDNSFNREIAKFILEDSGLIVEEADDGDIAIDIVQRYYANGDYNHFDFILMDVQMPRMNGYEATAKIRQLPAPDNFHVPIIAITANAFEEDKQNSVIAGMDAHLSKPIDIKKLQKTLESFL